MNCRLHRDNTYQAESQVTIQSKIEPELKRFKWRHWASRQFRYLSKAKAILKVSGFNISPKIHIRNHCEALRLTMHAISLTQMPKKKNGHSITVHTPVPTTWRLTWTTAITQDSCSLEPYLAAGPLCMYHFTRLFSPWWLQVTYICCMVLLEGGRAG